MSNSGIKISREGIDVKEAHQKDLIFNSNLPLIKSKDDGLASVLITSSNYDEMFGDLDISVTIYHNLDYKPRVFARHSLVTGSEDSDEGIFVPMPYQQGSSGGVIMYGAGYDISGTELVLWANGYGWSGITIGEYMNFKYEIFYNTE